MIGVSQQARAEVTARRPCVLYQPVRPSSALPRPRKPLNDEIVHLRGFSSCRSEGSTDALTQIIKTQLCCNRAQDVVLYPQTWVPPTAYTANLHHFARELGWRNWQKSMR